MIFKVAKYGMMHGVMSDLRAVWGTGPMSFLEVLDEAHLIPAGYFCSTRML
jgi:hypothetical protein